ncbi:plasma membrane ATPase 2-like [Papaver somniferum]|uniref:plasma membrane ATPase 2-like n=1 Tax=Papaver somniferum TaxID=3469 RepID=UPI000E7035A9|nr:plasma membrane ATPase 2-like [Papaver somniferum]XP_026449089.1 plasma membrane ATPase 2-like [Papaver somniferum]
MEEIPSMGNICNGKKDVYFLLKFASDCYPFVAFEGGVGWCSRGSVSLFSPTEKRTTLTYIDYEGNMQRAGKGAPVQISVESLRSLGVAYQLGSPRRTGSIYGSLSVSCYSLTHLYMTMLRQLGVLGIKMITGDQVAIGKETCHRLGMGTKPTCTPHFCIARPDHGAPALKKADVGSAVSDLVDAARSALDIALTESWILAQNEF